MLNQSTRNTVKAIFPFLVPVVRKSQSIVSFIHERNRKKGAFLGVEGIGYPLSSLKIHGAHDRSRISFGLYDAFINAIASTNNLPDGVYEIDGMSGRSYRRFLNTLVRTLSPTQYLEIGSLNGSTLVAALFGNECKALCIDNWSQFGGSKRNFMKNVHDFQLVDRVSLIEEDFRNVDFGIVGKFDIFLYDGPHEEIDHYDGIINPQAALKKEHVLIIDDWNWLQVRLGTFRALSALGSKIQFGIELRTTEDNTHPVRAGKQSEWHNGCFVAVVQQAI